tara:strand:+ start:287 stop:454 length:168 start_codon:yes stop_codon:yes gene_type:complete
MATDLSIVQAIIKRCITDEELELEKKIPDFSSFSKSSAFKKIKKFMDRHLQHALN